MTAGVPWREIEAVFLDVGNTLVSIDFERVAAELAARGERCEVAALERAEAAARPVVSRGLAARGTTEGLDSFGLYLRCIFERLPGAGSRADALARELGPALHRPGHSDLLWCRVLPGVPEALARLAALGLDLVVVSNADGTVERGLEARGLRRHFRAVIDSAVVGAEKPDAAIFRHALDACGRAPERVVHVGDMHHADVVGARAAGLHAVLLDPWDDWGEVDCERLAGVPELARRLAGARPQERG